VAIDDVSRAAPIRDDPRVELHVCGQARRAFVVSTSMQGDTMNRRAEFYHAPERSYAWHPMPGATGHKQFDRKEVAASTEVLDVTMGDNFMHIERPDT
jgi:hypothetical protein